MADAVSTNHISTTSSFDDLLPTTTPTATWEPWQCTTEKLSQYLQVPKPSGELITAFFSYNDELIESCTPTGTNIYGVPACAYPDASLWCDFTTAVPTSLLPQFSTYASSASSWWAAHSSKALSLAHECPLGWFDALVTTPGGEAWLNQTLIFADCLANKADANDDITTDVVATIKTSEAGGAMSTSTPTSQEEAKETQTADKPDSGVGKTRHSTRWVTAVAVVAATMVNSAF